MPNKRFPDLGLFFGDQGGPGTTLPAGDAQRQCPFLDQQAKEFCSLDGAMCPFVGFNHRKCKKYMNNVARGSLSPNGIEPSVRTKEGKPPRHEALVEGKKGGPQDAADWEAFSHMSPDFAKKSAKAKEDLTKLKKKTKKHPKFRAGFHQRYMASQRHIKSPATPEEADELFGLVLDKLDEFMTPANVLTATGKSEAEYMASEMERERLIVGPKTPGVVKKAREMAKPRGKNKTSQKKMDYNAAQRGMLLAFAREHQGFDSDGGDYTRRVAAINAFFDVANERIDRELTHPTPWGHDLRSKADFGVGGLQSTDDEVADPIWGKAYAGSEVGASTSADSNVEPTVKPLRSHSNRFTMKAISPDRNAKMGARYHRVQAQKLHLDLHKKHTRKSKSFSWPKGKDRPGVPVDVETLADFDGIPDDIPDPEDIKITKKKGGSAGPTKSKPVKRPRFTLTARALAKADDGGGVRVSRTHASGLPQATTKVRRPEQLASWFSSKTRQQLNMIFRGKAASGYRGPASAVRMAERAYATNNPGDVARMHKFFEGRLEAAEKAESKKIDFEREFQNTIRQSKAAGQITDRQIKELGRDPKQLDKVVKFQNTLLDNLFTMRTKKLKIGNTEVTQFLKDVTLPVMDRADFEAIRMSEQLSMAAIQRQHQYGRKYGKFTTINLFVQQVLLPFIMAFLPLDGQAKSVLMKAVSSRYPRGFLDSFYFNFIENPLPKYKGSEGPIPSKDTKFQASQKMANTGRHDSIMKGFYDDKAGIYTPPDRAVLHTRSYPTTKSTWRKTRKKAYTQRYQAAQANDGADWKRGFLRR